MMKAAPAPPPPPSALASIPTSKKMQKATSTNGLSSMLAGTALRKSEARPEKERDISADLSLELVGAIKGGLKLRKVQQKADEKDEAADKTIDFAARLRKTPVLPDGKREEAEARSEAGSSGADFGVRLKRRSMVLEKTDLRLSSLEEGDAARSAPKEGRPSEKEQQEQQQPEWMRKRRQIRSMDSAAFSRLFKEEGASFQ